MKPKIEHKQPIRRTPINLLEAKVARGERVARDLLVALERALVACGYTRDGRYNSRFDGYSGRQGPQTVVEWKGGKILLHRGWRRDPKTGEILIDKKKQEAAKRAGSKGSKFAGRTRVNPATVDTMTAQELVTVAHHLAPFVDALEGSVRHLAEAMERACATIEAMIERINADPRPSDSPAQMPAETEYEEVVDADQPQGQGREAGDEDVGPVGGHPRSDADDR